MTKKSTKGSGLRAQGKHKPVLALASKKNSTPFARIEDAVAAVRDGKMILSQDQVPLETGGNEFAWSSTGSFHPTFSPVLGELDQRVDSDFVDAERDGRSTDRGGDFS